MPEKAPVLHFREGLDADGKFLLHAAAHFHAARVRVGHYRHWRRTMVFLLSLVLDHLTDYIDVGKRLGVDRVDVYRLTKRVSQGSF